MKEEKKIEEKADSQEKGEHEEANDGMDSSRIAELERLLEEEKNLRLRALADYQNMKNRVEKEREELVQYAQTSLLVKLFDVLDDFKIFLDSSEHIDDAWKKGIALVYQKLLDIVKNEGVEMMDITPGDQFDPMMHEAITFTAPEKDEHDGKIAQVISNGYKRINNGKIIRTAKVIVYKKS